MVTCMFEDMCPLHSALDCNGSLTAKIWLVLDVLQVLVMFDTAHTVLVLQN